MARTTSRTNGKRRHKRLRKREFRAGIEPAIEALQATALPLGDRNVEKFPGGEVTVEGLGVDV